MNADELLQNLHSLRKSHAELVAKSQELDARAEDNRKRMEEAAGPDDLRLKMMLNHEREMALLRQRLDSLESLVMKVGITSLEGLKMLGVELRVPTD